MKSVSSTEYHSAKFFSDYLESKFTKAQESVSSMSLVSHHDVAVPVKPTGVLGTLQNLFGF
jgi:hypothetical protein